MPNAIEYRSVIRFLLLRKYDNQTIITELTAAYGDEAPSRATVYNWIREFKGGRTDVSDEKSSGRPLEIGQDYEQRLEKIVRDERRITYSDLADRLHISKGTTVTLLRNMGIRKLCSRFVPYFLTAEMCERRLECCQHNMQLYEQFGNAFLNNIVTEDETPLSLYLPEDKRTSAEFKFPDETPTRKLRTGTTHRRALMLTVFWDSHGLIQLDMVDKTVKINAVYYVELIKIARNKRRKPRNQPLYLLHDNAPIHTASHTQEAIQERGFTSLPHPPYSPDLAPSDFHMFRHLKKHLRGHHFHNKQELEATVTEYLTSRPQKFYQDAFAELLIRWQKCINNRGSYFEKK